MQVLDSKVITELRDMLEDELDELFGELLQQVPEELAAMNTCAANGDLDTIQQKAHQIKGSASNLGVIAFAEACRLLEEGLRTGDIHDPLPHLLSLQNSFDQAVPEIRALANC